MIDEILLECEEHMSTTVDRTREELTTIRTGRANPAMFNGVVADYYGVPTPITQMATVSVPEARMMLIKPYEMSMMGVIENAIRNVRRKGMDQLKKIHKDGDAGEDEVQAAEKELDKVTQKYVAAVDEVVQKKEAELMEV